MGGIRNILSPFVTNLIQSASTSLLLLRLNWKGIIWLLWVVSPYFVFGQINWSLPKNIRYQAELSYQFVQKKLQDPELDFSKRIEYTCILSGLHNKKGQFGEAQKVLMEIKDVGKAPVSTQVKYALAQAINKKFLNEPEEAIRYYNWAIVVAYKAGESFLYLESLIEKAEFFRRVVELDEGLLLIESALFKLEKLKGRFPELRAYALNRKAAILNELNKTEESLVQSRKSILVSKRIENPYLLATSYNEMGFSYKNLAMVDSALLYYHKAEQAFRKGAMLLDALHVKFNRLEMCAHFGIYMDEVIHSLKEMVREIDEKKINYSKRMIYMYLAIEAEELSNFQEALEYRIKYHEVYAEEVHKEAFKEIENVRQQEQNKRIIQENKSYAKELLSKKAELRLKDEKLIGYMIGLFFLLGILIIMLRMYFSKKKLTQILEKRNLQKDFLIQEVHHRVKNNLHFIQSLLEMQRNSTDKIEEAIALQEASVRISSISLVHEMLYQDDASNVIKVKDYINDLMQNLFITFNLSDRTVKIQKEVDDIYMSIQQCTALGIIITEIFTNSTKYAFEQVENPEFFINLIRNKETQEVHLIVRNNGPYVDLQALQQNTGSLGMRLIDIFSRQLNGNYCIDWQNGFIYELHFYLNEEEGIGG